MTKKFTDGEYLKLYEQGLNDREAAKKLEVTSSAVSHRRRKLGKPPNRQKEPMNKEEIISRIREIAREIKRKPSRSYDFKLTYQAKKEFGSWSNAIEETGFYGGDWERKWLLESLQKFAEKLGKSPTTEAFLESDYSWLCNRIIEHFGSWNEAKREAGLEIYSKGWNRDFTKYKLIDIIKKEGPTTQKGLYEIARDRIEIFFARGTYRNWIADIKRERDIKAFECHMYGGTGPKKYRSHNIFKSKYCGKKILYFDDIKLVEYLRDNALKDNLGPSMLSGKKAALTNLLKKRVSREATNYLRKQYLKRPQKDL